jgi:hypothetical protein
MKVYCSLGNLLRTKSWIGMAPAHVLFFTKMTLTHVASCNMVDLSKLFGACRSHSMNLFPFFVQGLNYLDESYTSIMILFDYLLSKKCVIIVNYDKFVGIGVKRHHLCLEFFSSLFLYMSLYSLFDARSINDDESAMQLFDYASEPYSKYWLLRYE